MVRVHPDLESIVAVTKANNSRRTPLHGQVLRKDVARYETRKFDSDGPGEYAFAGPRHDNDHVYIDQIGLLPTPDECLSLRAPWMPSKNIDSAHFMPHGYARNIDVHFRLLRHDSIEKVRDINYNAAQQAFLSDTTVHELYEKEFLETTIGNRYFLYHNLRVEDIVAGENEGVILRMSFDCPKKLRGRQMHKSIRLEKDMLSAVLALNHETKELSIHYFNIQARQSTYSLATKNGHERRAAVELSLLSDATKEDIQAALSIAVGVQSNVSMALVEYPKMLYVGFANVLHCLQRMSDFDYAFGQYISPRPEAFESNQTNITVQPPSYAQQPDFAFDFHPLTGSSDSRFTLQDLLGGKLRDTLKHLESNTTLDRGQALALLSSLSRELSFTQGPPGCGKTFLGVALTQVLLASRPTESKKPILLVCRTNHALDSFMAGLREANVLNLMRIGNGSKAEWTKSINIRAISREHDYSPRERGKRFRINEKKDAAWELLDAWCRDLSKEVLTGLPCWQLIYPIVRDHYPKMYAQLVTHTANPLACAFTYDYWAKGGDLTTIESLHQELLIRLNASVKEDEKCGLSEDSAKSFLADISAYTKAQSSSAGEDDIWHLTLEHRTRLIRDWQTRINKHKTVSQLLRIHEDHKELLKSVKSIRDDKDIRTMLKQNVVGMTTTACASRWDLLKAVGFEIMICEEAAEVLEAHNLCSLLPTIKHAIHIGDPQQLRPSTEEQSLAFENVHGKSYRLDESLFERIMKPVDPRARTIPTTKLNIQRRMHPKIANISRITYPFLEDHNSTYLHALPKGLQHRLWWLDHQIPEDDANGVSKSITNEHEVGLVKELVTYLLRGNDYNYGDIAILTPYSGQLLKLREALSTEFSVWLSDQDKESLVEAGAIDPDSDDLDDQKRLSIAMNDYIRLATIDNFQGEEAKILILSLVRSGGRLGFVKSPNRINVACSRAREGFYVIGDSTSLEADPKWKSIINVFRAQQSIGQWIRLQCDRHPEHHKFAKSAYDITSFTRCTVLCGQELPCGHLCTESCHDLTLHKIMSCRQPCRRSLACGHQCQNTCTEACGPCNEKISRYISSCGHTILAPCSIERIECDHFEGYYSPPCGKHTIEYTCGEPAKSKICDAVCGDHLSCGHNCNAACGSCYMDTKHPECTQICDKSLSCRHQCKSTCHGSSDCPPCEQRANPACCHENTERKCSEMPKPCLTPVSASGPDRQLHNVPCCFTTNMSISHLAPRLSTPAEIEPLVQTIIPSFIETSETIDTQIAHRAEVLSRTLQLFLMHQVQSATITASSTIAAVLHRNDETTALQTKITFEQYLLSTFNRSLQILSNYYPGETVTSLNGLLASKLHELELRAALMKARDTFAIVAFLAECDDQSRQMQRTANELALFAKTELTALLEKMGQDKLVEDLVEECRCLLKEVGTMDKTGGEGC